MRHRSIEFVAVIMVIGAVVLSSSIPGAVAADLQKGATPVTADDSDVNRAAQEQIAQWLIAVREVRPEDYVVVHDLSGLADAVRVEQDSTYWSERFFTMAANPYRQQLPVRRSTHGATPTTFDVLRHEYDAVGRHLIVDETVNFFLITVEPPLDLSANDERAKRDEIAGIAESILKMNGSMVTMNLQNASYHWLFRFPPVIRDGVVFSTNPEQSPQRMWSWASRLDGGIYRGHFYLLCFKKKEATSGRIFTLDAQHWFDGKCWAILEK